MKDLYVKNKDGDFIPIDINTVFTDDLADHLVIIKIGSDEHPASASDMDTAENIVAQADVLNSVRNITVFLTPYNISVEALSDDEIADKNICLQINGSGDVGMLDDELKDLYHKMNGKFKTVVLPSPLKVGEYRKIKDILKRSKIRKERRSRVKG
jgi:hypothetical protein